MAQIKVTNLDEFKRKMRFIADVLELNDRNYNTFYRKLEEKAPDMGNPVIKYLPTAEALGKSQSEVRIVFNQLVDSTKKDLAMLEELENSNMTFITK